jgi:hypothetical protein
MINTADSHPIAASGYACNAQSVGARPQRGIFTLIRSMHFPTILPPAILPASESSEMNDAIRALMSEQRTEFAVAGVRRQAIRLAGTASLSGARSSQCAEDPGGGPAR